jgi:Fe-S-cluster containining protein
MKIMLNPDIHAHEATYASSVPCSGCTRCCRGDAIRLLPDEDASQYLTEPHERFPGELMLAHNKNDDCIYLGHDGCTIHERKPVMCRVFDCRIIAQSLTWTQARKANTEGLINITVWKRGKELLKSN